MSPACDRMASVCSWPASDSSTVCAFSSTQKSPGPFSSFCRESFGTSSFSR